MNKTIINTPRRRLILGGCFVLIPSLTFRFREKSSQKSGPIYRVTSPCRARFGIFFLVPCFGPKTQTGKCALEGAHFVGAGRVPA